MQIFYHFLCTSFAHLCCYCICHNPLSCTDHWPLTKSHFRISAGSKRALETPWSDFIFMQLSANLWPHNMLTSLSGIASLWEILDPPLRMTHHNFQQSQEWHPRDNETAGAPKSSGENSFLLQFSTYSACFVFLMRNSAGT